MGNYKYCEASQKRLRECHPDLQKLFNEAINYWNVSILDGHRSRKQQNKLYRDGKTQLSYPESLHNREPSLAVDAAVYLPEEGVPWEKDYTLTFFSGKILGLAHKMDIPLRAGADWDEDGVPVLEDSEENFFDGVHFELDGPGYDV